MRSLSLLPMRHTTSSCSFVLNWKNLEKFLRLSSRISYFLKCDSESYKNALLLPSAETGVGLFVKRRFVHFAVAILLLIIAKVLDVGCPWEKWACLSIFYWKMSCPFSSFLKSLNLYNYISNKRRLWILHMFLFVLGLFFFPAWDTAWKTEVRRAGAFLKTFCNL